MAKNLPTPNSGNGSAGSTAGSCAKETQSDASKCEGSNIIYSRTGAGGASAALNTGTSAANATSAGGDGTGPTIPAIDTPDTGEDQAGVFCDGLDDSGCEGTSLPDGTP